jgi:hypothetical protein
MHSRALIYVLIAVVWLVFTGAVIAYQNRDSRRAGEHPESDADMDPGEPEFPAAA